VGEESHLEEMRSAIRGDFERLAERRGEQELLHVPEAPEPGAGDPAAEESKREAPQRSWLARLFPP
jgi:hypothetical protein